MISSQTLLLARSRLRNTLSAVWKHQQRRMLSSPPQTGKEAAHRATTETLSTADKPSLVDKLPKYLKPYASRFRDRPALHILSLLILHELTAILPLGGLFYAFHVTHWTPASLLPVDWVEAGEARMEKYARKKGWEWVSGKEGARILLELGTAYAAVKALLPLRMGLSVWATPWFARVCVIPASNLLRKLKPGGSK